MRLKHAKVLLTGADGGIGRFVASGLIDRGAKPVISSHNPEALKHLAGQLAARDGGACFAIAANLSTREGCERLYHESKQLLGKIDVLINLAGVMNFNAFWEESLDKLELIFRVNAIAPVLLSRLVLPEMVQQGSGQIVNVGSALGSIGLPFHASYSSTKFALRGFSEALRRELEGTGVKVTYVAPRAAATGLTNADMAKAAGMHMDSPELVARRILGATESGAAECYIGFPESIFARLNGTFPRLVDAGLRKQSEAMKPFALGLAAARGENE